MGAVHQNTGDQRGIGDVELEHSGKGVLGTTDGGHQGHIHNGLTCHVKGAGERNLCRSSRGQHAIASDFLDVHGVNHLTVHGIGHGLDGHIAAGVVVDLAGEVDRLATHHQLLIAHCAGDTGIDPLTSPHGSGNGDVLVGLSDAQIVVGVVVAVKGKGHSTVAAGQGLAGCNQTTVDDYLYLGIAGVGGVADLGLYSDPLLLLGQDGAHSVAVERIQDGQIVVLGGVHPVVGNGIVNALISQVRGQHHTAGGVGVAPVTLVVVLVVCGGHMPPLVQSTGVVLIAGEVAAGANGSFAVAHLNEGDALIQCGGVERKVLEITKGGAGMVELGQRGTDLHQHIIVVLIAFGAAGLIAELAVATAFKTWGVEGVDVTEPIRPSHLKAIETHKVLSGGIGSCLVALGPLAADGGAVIFQAHPVGTLIVEGVGVVSDRQEVQIVHLRGMVKGLLHAARTVGDVGMGVKLSKVEVVVIQRHRSLISKLRHRAGLSLGTCLFIGGQIGDSLEGQRLIHSGHRHILPHLESLGVGFAVGGGLGAVGGVVDGGTLHAHQFNGSTLGQRGSAGRGSPHLQLGGFRLRFGHTLHHLEDHTGFVVFAGGPIVILVIPKQVVAPTLVFHIVYSCGITGFQRPGLVLPCTGIHAGIASRHAQSLTPIGEGKAGFSISPHRPHLGGLIAGEGSLFQLHRHTHWVVGALHVGGQGQHGIRRVDHHLVTSGNGSLSLLPAIRHQRLVVHIKAATAEKLKRINFRLTGVHAIAGKVATIVFQILRLSVGYGIGSLDIESTPCLFQIKLRILSQLLHQSDVGTVQIEEALVTFENIVAVLLIDLELGRTLGKGQGIIADLGIHSHQLVLGAAGTTGVGIALAAHDFVGFRIVDGHHVALCDCLHPLGSGRRLNGVADGLDGALGAIQHGHRL